jgi:hypothetical protein
LVSVKSPSMTHPVKTATDVLLVGLARRSSLRRRPLRRLGVHGASWPGRVLASSERAKSAGAEMRRSHAAHQGRGASESCRASFAAGRATAASRAGVREDVAQRESKHRLLQIGRASRSRRRAR